MRPTYEFVDELQIASTEISNGLAKFAVLPDWLAAATQPPWVAAVLAALMPDLPAGGEFLHECAPELLRLKEDAWTVRYRATVSGHGSPPRDVWLTGRLHPPQPVRLGSTASAFGTDDWRGVVRDLGLELHTEDSDDALPAISRLTDADQVRELLEDVIRAIPAHAGFSIAACTPRVKRYTRGSRCTILCELDYPPRTTVRPWRAVVAKTYRRDKGQNAYASMQRLWDSALGRSPVVTLAEPIAYVPDLRLLVQGTIPGDETLADLIRSALNRGAAERHHGLDHYVAQAARGLAALHASGVHHGATATIEDELGGVRRLIARLAVPIPELANAATPLLARVTELAARHPADHARPAHGTFRPAQVLVDDGGVGFIDFDASCQAEPALDIARFRSSVREIGSNRSATEAGLTDADHICERFLACYEDIVPVSRARVLLWETLDLLTYVLHAWTKVRPAVLAGRLLVLERHVRATGLSG